MRRSVVVVAGIGIAGALAPLAPARAEDTDVTFELTAAGGLAISAPATADLGSGATNGGSFSGSLGTVTVTDDRGTLLGEWTASVSSTDFTTGTATAAETIDSANVRYWAGLPTAFTGVAVLLPGQATELLAEDLSTSRTAFSATGAIGNNSASWAPTVIVDVPAAAVAGVYTGTVTHSVA